MRDYKSMKKYGCLILFLLMLSSAFAAEVEPDVVQALEQDSEAPVIVILKEGAGKSAAASILENHGDDDDVDVNVERRYSSIPGFSGTITSEGLERLDDDPGVESIFLDKVLHITLDTSVAQVNAPAVWNFSVGGYNITGKGETVCVLDTGIDTDHPAFQDKIKSQYCYCGGNCCPGGTSEEANAEDDNALGHGTHVAGIAAGNLTTYMGIARDAGIYAIKVCDAAGSCATSDILAGIDRCSDPANISAFNLSAISLSLGDSSQNNAYCNDDALAPAINTAVGRNISVVIASGNDGFTAGISAPACVQNATPVGTVNDDDAIQYNRGAILELLAPGDSIISATIGGGTAALSGSSMAAPHLSGSIALLRQYWRLAYGRTPTVDELERKFMITGRVVDDSGNSGKSYSRIDLLTALSPFLNFSEASVANNSFTNTNTSFITAVSDVNLTNALLEWSYSNGSIVNITLDKVNGTGFYLNLTHLREGQDTYRVYGNDTVGTIGISVGRVLTIDTTVPAVTLSSPANGSNLSSGSVEFNATMLEANINAVRFLFSNASGNDFNLSPANHSGNWNANVNLSRLTEGLQSMLAYADDRAGNLNSTQLVEFTVARPPPAVTVISPNSGQNYSLASGNQVFNASVADALLSVPAVRFSFDNASGNGFNLTATLQSGYWSVQYNVSTLSNGSHTVTILSNDTAGNYNTTETISFTVDTGMLQVQLLTPVDGNINSSTALNFNCSVQDYIELSNLTLYGNWSSGWHANETVAVSGNRSSVVFSKTLPEGTYAWNCRAYDTVHHSIFAPANYTLTVDATAPVISAVSSGTPSSESATITWTTSESADARVDYGTSLSLGTISSTASRSTSQSRTLSGLDAATTYFFNVTSCDAANNCLTNGTFNFTAAAASGSGSADAGGGAAGGGGVPSSRMPPTKRPATNRMNAAAATRPRMM